MPNRIVVVIEDGLVSEVYSEDKVDILVLDKDCEGSDDYTSFKIKTPGTLAEDEFDALVVQPQEEVFPAIVKQFFDQAS